MFIPLTLLCCLPEGCIIIVSVYFLGQLVSGKWQNVRDSFIKSLKKKSGQATSKNIYLP